MDLGFSWISDFVGWCVQCVPRLDLCDSRHGGVKFVGRIFRAGVKTVEIKPGLYLWWPVTTEVQTIPKVRQSIDLPAQSLDTKDGKPVMVSMRLVVEVADVVKAITKTVDIEDLIMEIGGTAAVNSIVTRSYESLLKAQAKRAPKGAAGSVIEKELLEAARKLLRSYGVKVIQASFVDCVKHTPIRTEGGGNIVTIARDEE